MPHNLKLAVLFVLATLGLGASANQNVTGKIVYDGKAPAGAVVVMNTDPVCQQAHVGKPVHKADLLVGPHGELANVFVFIKDGVNPAKVPPVSKTPVLLDQRGCLYYPAVIGVRVGQTLRMRNSDPTFHNIHATALLNPEFNVMTTKGQTVDKTFTKPEVMVHLKCDIHGWMNAYVGVVDNPYFAVTDHKGRFTLDGVPPGEYQVEAWHEKLGTLTAKLVVSDRGTPALDFKFPPASN